MASVDRGCRTIVLAGPEGRGLRQRFPPGWPVRVHARLEAALPDLSSADVLVFAASDLKRAGARRALRLVRTAAPTLPVVLGTRLELENLQDLAAVRVDRLFLLDSPEEAQLVDMVRGLCDDRIFSLMADRCRTLAADTPVVARAAEVACLQEPLELSEAVERQSSGRVVFLRSVRSVSDVVGCHPDYLSRSATALGIRFAPLLRWVTLLRGLGLFRMRRSPWGHIAIRLGFEEPSSWAHFVRRLVGRTPRQAILLPTRELHRGALQGAFGSDAHLISTPIRDRQTAPGIDKHGRSVKP